MNSTTLAQALSATASSITLTDAGDLVKGDLLALEGEYCRILVVLTSKQALLQRGVNGTPATAHASGVTVSISVPEDFLTGPQMLPAFGIDTNVLTGLGPTAAATFQAGGGGGSGTVTSVALTMPSLFTVTGSPITTAGTLDVTLTGVLAGANGGTGVANTSKTITLSGNLVTTGAFNPTFAIPSSSTWTFPTGGGTLVVSSGAVTSIAGTANQITASAATGAVTLSIPTNPIFSGTALTFPGTLSIASGKTLTASNTLTIVATDGITMTTPTTSFTAARTDAANTFTLANNTTSTIAGGSVTGSGTASFESITGTWNTSGVPQAWNLNIINTASGSASQMMTVQLSGVNHFSLKRSSAFDYPELWLKSSGVTTGVAISSPASNIIDISGSHAITGTTGVDIVGRFDFTASTGGLRIFNTGNFSWSSTSSGNGSADLILARDAANTLALRNGTNAQTFNIGNTITTVATAGEWFTIDWQTTANVVNLQAVKGSSSGTARVMTLSYGGLKASPVPAITIPITSGDIVFGGPVYPTGYKSSDGSAGVSAGPYTAITSITVKNGLITAITGT